MRTHFTALLLLFSLSSLANDEVPELRIEKVKENIFLHTSYSRVNGFGLVSSNGLVVIDKGNAFIVDTPWSDRDTETLVHWIRKNGYELLGSVSTHWHEDRTAGIKWLNDQSISTYATTSTNHLLKENKKEPAKYTLKGNESTLVDGLIEVFYPGGGHTIDNVVVWLPKSKILFGGCFVRSLDSEGLGYTGEAHIDQWSRSAQNALSRYSEAQIVIPGHGKIGDIALLKHTKSLAETASNKSIQPNAHASAD